VFFRVFSLTRQYTQAKKGTKPFGGFRPQKPINLPVLKYAAYALLDYSEETPLSRSAPFIGVLENEYSLELHTQTKFGDLTLY